MELATGKEPVRWLKRPLPVVLAALWAGLVLGRFQPWALPAWSAWAFWAAAAGATLAWLVLLRRNTRPRLVLPLTVFVLTGLALIWPFEKPLSQLPSGHLIHLAGQKVVIEAMVAAQPQKREWGTYLTVRARSVLTMDRDRAERPASGRVRLLLGSRGEPWPKLGYGSLIRFQARLSPIRDFANRPPGGYLFSYRRYLADRAVHLRASISNPAALMVLGRPGGWALWRLVEGWRARARDLIERAVPQPSAGLLGAILLGDRNGLDKDLREAFQKTGTAHLLVVSGLHLTMVALLAGLLFRFLLTRSVRLCLGTNVILLARLLALGPVLGYALLSGLSIPTWRAFVLVATAWAALALWRRMDGPSALALAGLIITLLWPPALFDTGFQLSFIAVAVLMSLGGALEKRLRFDPAGRGRLSPWRRTALRGFNYLAGLAVSSILMAVFLAPILALSFGRVPLLGTALNMVLIPLYTLLAVPLGLAGLFLSLIHPALGTWPLSLAAQTALAGANLVAGASQWDWVSLRIMGLTLTEAVLMYAVLGGGVLAASGRTSRRGLILVAAGLLALIGDGAWWHHRNHDARMVVEILDVGQGTSLLMRLPGRETWLMDGGFRSSGGFDVGRSAVAPALWSRKTDRVDTVVLSHPHPDHCGGLPFLVEEFNPRRFVHPGHRDGSLMYSELLKKIEMSGIPRLSLAALHRGLDLGPVSIRALWPPPDFEGKTPRPKWYGNLNETSLVLKITHGRVRFLFTADIESRAEEALCRLHDQGTVDLSAEILYLPHHGSSTSSGPDFLERVGPELALASCGPGPGKWPHPEVLARLEQAGVEVLATNTWGGLTVSSSGTGYEVRTGLSRSR